jgi:hypothetical protein
MFIGLGLDKLEVYNSVDDMHEYDNIKNFHKYDWGFNGVQVFDRHIQS